MVPLCFHRRFGTIGPAFVEAAWKVGEVIMLLNEFQVLKKLYMLRKVVLVAMVEGSLDGLGGGE